MAFFKFRTGASESPDTKDTHLATQTVEHLRRQARHRLIGAAVLVVLAVAGFPLVFDTQPRPVSADLSIDIPSKAKQDPSQAPPALTSRSGATPAAAEPLDHAGDPKQTLTDKEELVTAAEKASPAPAAVAAPKTDKTDKTDDASNTEASDKRYVVQAGSFSDEAKVRETRSKLEKAGLKTYTQVVEAKDGKRTRVRLGPFATKAEAEQAAEKAKSLQVQALVLSF